MSVCVSLETRVYAWKSNCYCSARPDSSNYPPNFRGACLMQLPEAQTLVAQQRVATFSKIGGRGEAYECPALRRNG